jgi:hypothetical protein
MQAWLQGDRRPRAGVRRAECRFGQAKFEVARAWRESRRHMLLAGESRWRRPDARGTRCYSYVVCSEAAAYYCMRHSGAIFGFDYSSMNERRPSHLVVGRHVGRRGRGTGRRTSSYMYSIPLPEGVMWFFLLCVGTWRGPSKLASTKGPL